MAVITAPPVCPLAYKTRFVRIEFDAAAVSG